MKASSALTETLGKAGFTLVRKRNHGIWECPCGHTRIPCSTTPGKGRSVWNTEALIARTLRACEQRRSAA